MRFQGSCGPLAEGFALMCVCVAAILLPKALL